jgi:membrane protease YdiL (CAAX protease family)
VREHRVAAFFLLAFVVSWAFWIPIVFMEPSWSAAILMLAGSFGAPVAAALVVWTGGDDVRAWARQLLDVRVAPRWWLIAFGLPVVATAAIAGLYWLAGGAISFADLPEWYFYPALMAWSLVLSGGLNEEPGWRGFAQPHLQERYGALRAAVGIGVVWGVWHLPLFFSPVAPHSGFLLVNKVMYLPAIVVLSVLLAWTYNNAGLWPTMVLHAGYNVVEAFLPAAQDALVVNGVVNESTVALITGLHFVVYLAIAAVVVYLYGRTLTRGEVPGPETAGARPEAAESGPRHDVA